MELIQSLRTIDWQQPWSQHLVALGQPLSQQIFQQMQITADYPSSTWLNLLNKHAHFLKNANGRPLAFVDHQLLTKGKPYELFIYETGMIPTRPNLHDFFNALIWLTFPRTKIMLNALQAKIILEHGITATRQRTRDLITLFDENGLVLLNSASTHDHLTLNLANANWSELFITQRALWHQHYQPLIFGHALLEKLLAPFKAITSHTLVLPAVLAQEKATISVKENELKDLPKIDACLAHALSASLQTQQRFYPLPVMGIPGWCRANEEEVFYYDTAVFRPKRIKKDMHA